jgi:hypothetical protein
MRHSSNVLRFPTGPSGGVSLKVFAILFYVSLAAAIINPLSILPRPGAFSLVIKPTLLSGDSLGLLLVLGLLYALVVKQWYKRAGFLRGRTWLIILLAVLLLLSVLHDLPFLLFLGLLYWLLVGRPKREAPYFLRFHLLTGLIANGLILLALLLFQSLMGFVESLSRLGGLEWFVSLAYWYGIFWPYLATLLFWGLACRLSFAALMGRTPYISVVTDNVRHWA